MSVSGQFILRLIASASVGMVIIMILTAALFATEFLPQSAIRIHLQRSFENGSLQDNDWPWEDRIRGYNQYNDCLLAMMPMFKTDRFSSAIAPVVVFNDYPTNLKISECAVARAAAFSANPRTLYNSDSYFPYYRYVHAYRIPFNILISLTTVNVIRALYRLAVLSIIAVTIVLHARRLVRARRSGETRTAILAFCGLGIALGLAIFSGLDLFAQSLTHGPSDMLTFGAFAWLTLGRSARGWRHDAAIASLAALAFALDFLHGTIPLTLAIVIGCAGLRAFEGHTGMSLAQIVETGMAFIAGLAGAAATKLTILIAAAGWDDILGYYYQLRYRMDGGNQGVGEVARALGGSLGHIAWGYAPVALPFVALSLIGILCIPAASFFLRISSRDRTAVLTVWLSIVTIFGWYIVFRSHSAMHAPFMVRLLAWPISATPACFLMLVSASAPGSKLIRLIAPQRHVTTDPAAAPPPKREQNGRQISPSGIRP